MKPRLDSVGGDSVSNNNTVSFDITLVGPTNAKIYIGIAAEDFVSSSDNNVTGVTVNSVAASQVLAREAVGSHLTQIELWEILASELPGPGTYTVVVTTAGVCEEIAAVAACFNNLRPQTAEATNSTIDSGTIPLSLAITPVTPNALLIAVFGSQNVDSGIAWTSPAIEAVEEGLATGANVTVGIAYQVVDPVAETTIEATIANPEGEALLLASYQYASFGGGGFIN